MCTTNLVGAAWGALDAELIYREARPDEREEVFYRHPQDSERSFYRLRLDRIEP